MLHISIDHCPSRLDWRNRGTPLQITPNGQVIWQVTVHEGATAAGWKPAPQGIPTLGAMSKPRGRGNYSGCGRNNAKLEANHAV
jgi:hypothetical protein